MAHVSNGTLLIRVLVAAVAFGLLSFVCGYFGPLYLLEDAGIGPLSGFFFAPIGIGVGTVCAVVGSTWRARMKYHEFIVIAALTLATILLAIVGWQ